MQTWQTGQPVFYILLEMSGCQYHYSPYVEIIFPMLQTPVLKMVLEQCDHCIHDTTAWGLDGMWCKWSVRMMNKNWWTGCAIIDETPVTHMNLRTLYKYNPSETNTTDQVHGAYNFQGRADRNETQLYHAEDYFSTSYSWSIQAQDCIQVQSVAAM
mmetsp:Transcript_85160/g.156038  ORF Transcript_85160/g.156038 Transcript_85160/m.156038 type:complete len:156 (+) Transcript_85160:577-1044(+)